MTRTRTAALVCAALAAAAAIDYSRPAKGLREFDPHEVARLETSMWRAYYEKRKLALFLDLVTSLRTQFGQPISSSVVTAFHAGRAAFLFKDGESRADYEKALPDLRAYYEPLLPPGEDVEKAARLELEWWIVHRERAVRPAGSLERSLAGLQSAIYHLPPEAATEHARLRAEAMLLRDQQAERGGVSDADWSKIQDLLDRSWTSLRRALD